MFLFSQSPLHTYSSMKLQSTRSFAHNDDDNCVIKLLCEFKAFRKCFGISFVSELKDMNEEVEEDTLKFISIREGWWERGRGKEVE